MSIFTLHQGLATPPSKATALGKLCHGDMVLVVVVLLQVQQR